MYPCSLFVLIWHSLDADATLGERRESIPVSRSHMTAKKGGSTLGRCLPSDIQSPDGAARRTHPATGSDFKPTFSTVEDTSFPQLADLRRQGAALDLQIVG